MADKILDRLVEAVNALKQHNGQDEAQNNSQDAKRPDGPGDTTNALKELYPSTRGRSAPKHPQSSSDRPPYKGSSSYSSKQSLPKKTSKKTTNSKPPVLKDIILLPSPHIDDVPRGTFRESLYTRKFAGSAIPIEEEMTEKELRCLFDDLFKEKLDSVKMDPIKYEFTRAIGNKIVSVNTPHGQVTGKVLKYLSKQGTVILHLYIYLLFIRFYIYLLFMCVFCVFIYLSLSVYIIFLFVKN